LFFATIFRYEDDYFIQVFDFYSILFCLEAVGTVFNDKIFIVGGLQYKEDPGVFTGALNTSYSITIPE